MKVSLIVDLAGNLQSRARQYAQALTGLSNSGNRAFSGLRNAAASVGRGLDGMGNRYTALITGAGTVATLKNAMTAQERVTRLGITADVSQEKVNELGQRIFDTAQSADIRVNPDQILAAVESIMEKTGDLKFAEANIRNIGLAIQAAGADGGAIGDIFAEFQKQGMRDKDALAAVDTLIAKGKAGAFTLKDIASLGPRVVTAYTALGRQGPQAMKEMGAVLQLIRMGTGSSEQAATAWEAMLRTFSDKKKVAFLKRQGITLFDKKGNLRAANEIMVEILKAAGNDAKNLSDVFDAEAIRAFNAILGELKRTGGVETLDRFMKISGDGTTIQNDSARAAQTATAALTNLRTAWVQFADRKLTEPIRHMADALNSLGSESAQKALDVAGNAAMLAGGAFLARKGYKAYQGVKGMFGSPAVGGPLSGAASMGGLGRLPLPLPVYIVNDRMSLTDGALSDIVNGGSGQAAGKGGAVPGKPGAPVRTPRLPGKGGRMARIADFGKQAARNGASPGKVAAKAGAPVAVIGGVIEAGSVIMDPNATTDDKVRGVSEAAGAAVGGWGGAAGGAAIGAAIGSIIPGLGTAIGGALGGLIGGWLGTEAGEGLGKMIGDKLTDKDQAKTIGAVISAKSAELAKNLAAESTIKIKVEGGQASIESTSGPGDIDVYYDALNMQGIMTMD